MKVDKKPLELRTYRRLCRQGGSLLVSLPKQFVDNVKMKNKEVVIVEIRGNVAFVMKQEEAHRRDRTRNMARYGSEVAADYKFVKIK